MSILNKIFNKKKDKLNIKLKKLNENAIIPSYAHNGDVGMDMTAISVEYDEEKDLYIYHTGLSFESDFNVGQFLFPRSSNRKTDAYLCNSVGIADSAIYRGEILFCFKNRDSLKSISEIEALKAMLNYDVDRCNMTKNEFYDSIIENYKERARKLEFAPYKVGDRIGQMVFLKYPTVDITIVDELSSTERGSGAFGSTGN